MGVVSGWLNMLLMGVLFGGFTGVPQLIDDRIIMQKEVTEALYIEVAHIIVGMVLDMVVTIVRNSLFVTIMYALSGLPWEWSAFGPFILWMILVGVVMDAVFNGIGFVTKNSAPALLRPVLYIMPSSRVAEQVALALYGNDAQTWASLESFMGLERASPVTCFVILSSWFVVFNAVAALALCFIKQVEK